MYSPGSLGGLLLRLLQLKRTACRVCAALCGLMGAAVGVASVDEAAPGSDLSVDVLETQTSQYGRGYVCKAGPSIKGRSSMVDQVSSVELVFLPRHVK